MRSKIILCVCVLMSLLCLCITSALSWNFMGHRVIAEVAYAHLTPRARIQVDALTKEWHQRDPFIHTFSDLSVWPDWIRHHDRNDDRFDHWHYINVSFSLDGTSSSVPLDSDNAVWAFHHVRSILKTRSAHSVYQLDQTKALAFFIHIVGDLHQPLHTVTMVSRDFPTGDYGGNRYRILNPHSSRGFARVKNLHQLWDQGVGWLPKGNRRDTAKRMAEYLMSAYPHSTMKMRSHDLNPSNWIQEGMDIAKEFAYTTPMNRVPTDFYIQHGQEISAERLVLAGYRLAHALNQIYP